MKKCLIVCNVLLASDNIESGNMQMLLLQTSTHVMEYILGVGWIITLFTEREKPLFEMFVQLTEIENVLFKMCL